LGRRRRKEKYEGTKEGVRKGGRGGRKKVYRQESMGKGNAGNFQTQRSLNIIPTPSQSLHMTDTSNHNVFLSSPPPQRLSEGHISMLQKKRTRFVHDEKMNVFPTTNFGLAPSVNVEKRADPKKTSDPISETCLIFVSVWAKKSRYPLSI
jgi:hypothetical protein